MAVQYAPQKLRVPEGFNNLLEGLAREVLRDQPENIIKFAAEYFKTQMLLRGEAVGNGSAAPKEEAPAEVAATEEAKPVEEAPKATEESPKAEETTEEVAKADETTPEEPPKAESPEQPAAEPKLSEDEAAAKIQAVIRGKKARNEVAAMKAEGGDAAATETPAENVETSAGETATESEPEKPTEVENEEESTPEEQEAAALKIQSSFRGMKARKEVENMKNTKEEGDAPAAEVTAEGGDTAAEN